MIHIRKATLKDSESIATCLLLAMESIVFGFIGETDPVKAREFMLHFVQKAHNQYSYQNCFVAEVEMNVVASVNIYNGAHLDELRKPVIDFLYTKYHRDYETGDETQEGEYYIDTLGVYPMYRGQGIGTKLLQYLIDEYVVGRKQTLGLLVDEKNTNAKRLYLNLGFRSVGIKYLFGKNMDHLQYKVIQ